MPVDPSGRLAVSRLLAGVNVHPTSLPPSAVLVVRRLADPAPRSLRPHEAAVQPPAAWQRALQSAIDRAAREAARPAAGPVPPSASAVVFLDPAELLACLARDFLLGDVSRSWWWQAWLRASGLTTLDLVLDAWCRDARHIPAAAVALHTRGLAERFAGALTARQARTLLAATVEAFEMPAFMSAVTSGDESPPALPEPTLVVTHVTRAGDEPAAEAPGRGTVADEPPWVGLNPPVHVSASLQIEQRTFLGVALALGQAPLAVRARGFQRLLHAWRRRAQSVAPGRAETDVRTVRSSASPAATPATPERALEVQRVVPAAEALEPLAESEARDLTRAQLPTVARTQSVDDDESVSDAGERHFPSVVSGSAVRNQPGEIDNGPRAIESRRPSLDRHRDPSPRDAQAIETHVMPEFLPAAADETIAPQGPAAFTPPRTHVHAVLTELGGVLFLVNVFQRLQLFDRLDDHFGVASSLGGWGWLEVVARCLLGRGQQQAAGDPLWQALAALDGRDEPPDAGAFRAPRSWSLPDGWPATARIPRRRTRALGFDPAPDLQRFLDPLVSYLRWRLLQALDFHAATRREEDARIVSRVFTRRARLEWTATHVDLHMDMSQIDIAVRLAGLDANPGWVPALGRVVTFYFD